ncbi:MAG: transposase [Candidatus Marinimicrobia bacterium]|nr:transposase [Candidatus Neomarinimicrobiota bacterium]
MKYIGMDAHSKNSYFVVLSRNGRMLHRKKVETREDTILEFVRSVKGSKKLSYEEGVMSQWLYLLLKDEVDELIVCQPPKSNGAKNDWLDAREIADLLRVNRLKSVFHSDDVLMNLRVLISGYDDLLQEIVRTKNRYSALYREAGISIKDGDIYEDQELLLQLNPEQRQLVGSSLYEQIQLLDLHKQKYVKQLVQNVHNYKPVKLLKGIPGLGTIRANHVVAVMVTPYRFARKGNLVAYSRLTKHGRMSDGKLYGRRRSLGQPILKDAFRGAALSSLNGNNAFRREYDTQRATGKNDKEARNKIAKMVAATVLGVWKSGKPYDDNYWEVTRKRNQSCSRHM